MNYTCMPRFCRYCVRDFGRPLDDELLFACLPTTVTPLPVLTILFSAVCFSFLTFPMLLAGVVTLSRLFSIMSRCFFFALRCFVCKALFSEGVSSDRERVSPPAGLKTSSGASMLEVAIAVGSADSIEAVATLETVEITALGWALLSNAREIHQNHRRTCFGTKCALHRASSLLQIFSQSFSISSCCFFIFSSPLFPAPLWLAR